MIYIFLDCCLSCKLSLGDINSKTKSGVIGEKFSCCSGVSASHLSFLIQARSGERFALLGSLKQV
jgi:hypothetical protein